MPKPYGARYEEIQRFRRGFLPPSVIQNVCRNEPGPSRRDPMGTLPMNAPTRVSTAPQQHNALQGASAMGSFAVTRPPNVRAVGTTFDFGVSVATRLAHANRAFAESFRIVREAFAGASNHRRGHDTRRCSLQNWTAKAVHGVHG
jgi:hypothetical protein